MTVKIAGYTLTPLRGATIAGGMKTYEYHHATHTDIYEAYQKPSDYKVEAFYDCLRMYRAMGGRNYRIPSYNGWSFTFAFELEHGEIVYITKDHNYIIK